MTKSPPKNLPVGPGVYFFKNDIDQVIYIGKAKSLAPRIRSYFLKTNDWKVASLVAEYEGLETIQTSNEHEALLLEAQLIKRYQPKFNVLLKSGQPFLFFLFTKEPIPRFKITRNKDAAGDYIGPFIHKTQVRSVYDFLCKTFGLKTCNKKIENGCLDYHLGLCAGTCRGSFDAEYYKACLSLAKHALKKDHKSFISLLDKKIADYSSTLAFEKARRLALHKQHIDAIFQALKTRFTDHKFESDIFIKTTALAALKNTAHASCELQKLLRLSTLPITIDCFDISHFQSSFIVGSCVRFTHGMPDKNKFRRFRIRTQYQQNDYACLQEIVERRYKQGTDVPTIILIDGGKGQLNAVNHLPYATTWISLAKKEELLFCSEYPDGIPLTPHTNVGRLLLSLRDYAHHFAVQYHQLLRKKGWRHANEHRKLHRRKPGTD